MNLATAPLKLNKAYRNLNNGRLPNESRKAQSANALMTIKPHSELWPYHAVKFGVRSIPAIFILKDAQVVKQFTGVQDKMTLLKALNENV